MPTLEELGLQVDPEEAEYIDLATLPRQMSTRTPLPQPGKYTFQLPQVLDDVFEVMATEGDPQAWVQFRGDRALVTKPDNLPIEWDVNTAGYPHGFGDNRIVISDLTYMLRALGEHEAPAMGLALAKLIIPHSGERFVADISWSGYCNPKSQIWKDGAKQEEKGCGATFELYQPKKDNGHQIQRAESGKYHQTWDCPTCGAKINARLRLQNFREYVEYEQGGDRQIG